MGNALDALLAANQDTEETALDDEAQPDEESAPAPEDGTQSNNGASVEHEPSTAEVSKMVKGLNKGFMATRQEINEIKQLIAESKQKQTDTGVDPYVTEKRLKEIVSEVLTGRETQQAQAVEEASTFLEEQFDTLVDQGYVTPAEKDDFFQHGLDMGEYKDMTRVALSYIKNKSTKPTTNTVQQRRQNGSKVGSADTSTTTSGKMSYAQVRAMSFDDID